MRYVQADDVLGVGLIANDSQPHVLAGIVSPTLEETSRRHALFHIFQCIDCGEEEKMRENAGRKGEVQHEARKKGRTEKPPGSNNEIMGR